MKITQESLPKSQLGLRVEIPAEDVAKRHEIVFKKILKNVRLPGFRPGKVPPHILRQYLGEDSIRASVVEELLETAMPKALEQIEVPTIGEPHLRDEMETLVRNYHPHHPFVFEIAIDVWPEVTLGDYHNLSVRASKYQFDPDMVEDTLREHQLRRATLVPVERPAQNEDVAIIDMDGYPLTETGRGEPREHFECRDMEVDIDLESGDFYPEVLTALVGMQVGETKEVTLVTDGEFWEEDMANQTFILKITLKELKEQELPELDDLFAQSISDCETMEELRDFLAQRHQKRCEELTQESLEQEITNALVEITTTELPQTLVERHLTELFNDVLNGLARRRGMDAKALNSWLTDGRVQEIGNELLPAANRQVKRILALRAIADREHITPDQEALTAALDLARRSETGADLSEEQLKQVVYESLRISKAMEWLQERAQITWVAPGEVQREVVGATGLVELASPIASETQPDELAPEAEPVEVTSKVKPDELAPETQPDAITSATDPVEREA